jgi:hypothetical protein
VTYSTIKDLSVKDPDAEIGVFAGVPYERVYGLLHGEVGESEEVVGLTGPRAYRAEFEVIRPVDPVSRSVVVVDAENRGVPSMLNLITGKVMPSGAPSSVTYPHGLGDRCLLDGNLAYARVQWQTGVCQGVTPDAQGVGLVVERDFGRLLSLEFDKRILAGMSQSSWFVNTFVAEGFNVDPVTGSGVFTDALAHLSAGNWLAINKLGDDGEHQQPYVRPNGVPLRADQILTRPDSDPFMVDIASYTDYYRLRASVFASGPSPACAVRYNFPGPHAPATPELTAAFVTLGCSGGELVPLNPVSSIPYVRALLMGLARDHDSLPPSRQFELGPGPEPSPYFNALPTVELLVPRVDGDGQPRGGVRFPDVELPLGRPEPVALAPCGTSSITDTCGNFGGWQPFSADELRRRYGTIDHYGERYAGVVDGLISDGFVLERDRESMIEAAWRSYAQCT